MSIPGVPIGGLKTVGQIDPTNPLVLPIMLKSVAATHQDQVNVTSLTFSRKREAPCRLLRALLPCLG